MQKTLLITLITVSLFMPMLAMAATPNPVPVGGTPVTLSTLQQFIDAIVSAFYRIALLAVVVGLVYAGFRMATAGSDSKKFDDAKKMLYQVIIGGLVIFGVGLIISTIANFATNPSQVLQ